MGARGETSEVVREQADVRVRLLRNRGYKVTWSIFGLLIPLLAMVDASASDDGGLMECPDPWRIVVQRFHEIVSPTLKDAQVAFEDCFKGAESDRISDSRIASVIRR